MVEDIVGQSDALVTISEQLITESQQLYIQSLELRAHSVRLRQRSGQLRQRFVRSQTVGQCADTEAPKRAQDQQEQYPPVIEIVSEAPPALPSDLHDTAMETLRSIRTLIDHFPLEVQVAMVKALTARTIIKARERLQPPTVLSA